MKVGCCVSNLLGDIFFWEFILGSERNFWLGREMLFLFLVFWIWKFCMMLNSLFCFLWKLGDFRVMFKCLYMVGRVRGFLEFDLLLDIF